MTKENFNKTYEPAILSKHARIMNGLLLFSNDKETTTTNSPLYDELSMNQISEYLQKINSLEFDSFYLSEISENRALTALSTHIFKELNLFSELDINPNTFVSCISEIENTYQNNPYHNNNHACDVAHTCYYILINTLLNTVLSNVQKFSVFSQLFLAGFSCNWS